MIAQATLQDGPGIQNLSRNHIARDVRAEPGIVRCMHLCDAQEDVAVLSAFDLRHGAPVFRQETDMHAALRAQAQQKGADEHIAKANYRLKRVDRQAHRDLLLALRDNRFAIAMQIDALSRHIQGVEKLPHGETSSTCRASQARADLPCDFGLQLSNSEHDSHHLPYSAGGIVPAEKS